MRASSIHSKLAESQAPISNRRDQALLTCSSYDGRFAANALNEEDRLAHLTALCQSFMATMADVGAETWIMHGTLLGWWWNQKILPWDSDLDVQVTERTIHFLAKYYNMTEYHFRIPGVKGGRTYLLEINANYRIRSTDDKLNMIDGRWIDTDSGLYIDISTVRANYEARAQGIEGALICKDKHHYLVSPSLSTDISGDRPFPRKKISSHSVTPISKASGPKSRISMPLYWRKSTAHSP
jgi:hypothetical protein